MNNMKMFKEQIRLKSEWHNVFTEKFKKAALSSNFDKIIQPIDLVKISIWNI